MVTRCEVDMVQIKQEFLRLYSKSLESFISVRFTVCNNYILLNSVCHVVASMRVGVCVCVFVCVCVHKCMYVCVGVHVCDSTYTMAIPIATNKLKFESLNVCVCPCVSMKVWLGFEISTFVNLNRFSRLCCQCLNLSKSRILTNRYTHPCVIHISLQCVYVQNSRSNTLNACSNQTQ